MAPLHALVYCFASTQYITLFVQNVFSLFGYFPTMFVGGIQLNFLIWLEPAGGGVSDVVDQMNGAVAVLSLPARLSYTKSCVITMSYAA